MDGISHVNEIKVLASKKFSTLSFELVPGNTGKKLVSYIKKGSEKTVSGQLIFPGFLLI
jgi:hypothetical protein